MLLLAAFGGVGTAIQAANQAVSMNMMRLSGASGSGWTQTGQWFVAQLVNLVSTAVAMLPIEKLDFLSWIALAWCVVGSLLIIITIPSVAPRRQSDSYVWTKWVNGNLNGIDQAPGLGGNQRAQDGYTVCNGLLMAQYLLLYYDSPSHMAEEVHRATWTVPRAILTTFFLGAGLNFALLLSYLYSIQIPGNVLLSGAGITGVVYGSGDNAHPYSLFPVGNLFWDGAFVCQHRGRPSRAARVAVVASP